jgi:hypothetical protein
VAFALLCFVLFLAIGVALLLVPGAGLVGVLFVVAAFAAAIWAVVALLTGGSVRVVLRWPRKPELLGPTDLTTRTPAGRRRRSRERFRRCLRVARQRNAPGYLRERVRHIGFDRRSVGVEAATMNSRSWVGALKDSRTTHAHPPNSTAAKLLERRLVAGA